VNGSSATVTDMPLRYPPRQAPREWSTRRSRSRRSNRRRRTSLRPREREPDAWQLASGLEVTDRPHRDREVVSRGLDVEQPGLGTLRARRPRAVALPLRGLPGLPRRRTLAAARGSAGFRHAQALVGGVVGERGAHAPQPRPARRAHRPARSAGSSGGQCRDRGASGDSGQVRHAAGIVILVHSMRHAGPAVAGDPDDLAVDTGVQISATPVLGEEGVQVGRPAESRPGASRKAPASARAGEEVGAAPARLLDDVVRPRQQGRRDSEAEGLGGFEVDR
jgi:hypothetical protein